jgi:hypothetical protein
MVLVETFSETLDGCFVEAICNSDRPDNLFLHGRVKRCFKTSRKIQHDGRIFIPRKLDEGLLRLVRFPPRSRPFGTLQNLTSLINEFLSQNTFLEAQQRFLLIAFALASWFSDATSVASVLSIFGPEREVSHVLRVLNTLCRKPILVGHATIASLGNLPAGLGATLLINERDLGAGVMRVLSAASRRHFNILRGSKCVDLYGAKAFARDESIVGLHGLELSVSPAREPLPTFNDAQERRIADAFQSKLLRLRMLRYQEVRDRRIDCSSFPPELQDQAQAWLVAIEEIPELTASVSAELQRQSQKLAGDRFSNPRLSVFEAALHFCHRENTDWMFVGEVADAANTLLAARHADPNLSCKRVGAILRSLGLVGQRDAKGYRIELNAENKKHIHRIAALCGVLSVDNVQRCSYCGDVPKLSPDPLA